MFSGFANQWSPVFLAKKLKKKPIRIEFAGEDIVLFRSKEGVGALFDRCPHRGVSLSLGKITKDGCLQCPFHGWHFAQDGSCQYVPFNPDAKRSQLEATALPVREKGGLIWVYSGFRPNAEPYIPEAVGKTGFATFYYQEDWHCHWTRAMENMLDYPHLPYVHKYTIGIPVRRAMKIDSRLSQELEEFDAGFHIHTQQDSREGVKLSWLSPNGMMMNTIPSGRIMRIHVWCVPTGKNQTRMILAVSRNFGVKNPIMALFDLVNIWILRQDRAVVESSQPSEIPEGMYERSVATDKPTLQFRKIYFQKIKNSETENPSSNPTQEVANIHSSAMQSFST